MLSRYLVITKLKDALDKRSVVYSTLGFGLMLYAFSSAGNLGFTNPIVVISAIIGILIVITFIRRQLSITNPLLNLKVLKAKYSLSVL